LVRQPGGTGGPSLLVEQAVEAAIRYADHVAVLDSGKVVLSGPASQVDDLSVLRDAYFGLKAAPALRAEES
jgi:branched-chain amino acid transport system ATP-binding protein